MKPKLQSLYRVAVRPTTKDLAGRFIAHRCHSRVGGNPIVAAGIALLVILMPNLCYAAFEDLGAGARVAGMGDAFVALADDINASYYNPAGLVQLKNIEIQAMYTGYYVGLSEGIGDGFIGYGQKMEGEMGAFSLGYMDRRISDIYKEITFAVSYAKGFRGDKFSLGGSLKYRNKSYRAEYDMSDPSQLDPVFKRSNSAYGVSIDLGFLYRPADFFSFGIFAGDINQPDISLMTRDILPMCFKMGVSCKFGENRSYTINIDGLYRDGDYNLNLGIENWIALKMTDVDFQYSSSPKSQIGWRTGLGLGTNEYKNFSLGTSYRHHSPDLQIDYAFIYPFSGIKNTYGTHRLAVIMRL